MKKALLVGLLLSLVLIGIGCEEPGKTIMRQEYTINQAQTERFQKTQPLPKIDYSATRGQVVRRIERWSDPNKISYIYLISFGRVMSFYTVKGSVESKRSYLSPVWRPYNPISSESSVVDAPDIDGTYGDNADSVFFFTTEDVYVEWKGEYMWVDQPLKLATQPELIYIAPLK